MSPPTKLESFKSILNDMIQYNAQMLELTRLKQQAIFDQDMEELEELTKKQRTVTGQIEKLNERRRDLSSELIDEDEPPYALEDVIDVFPDEEAEILSEKRVQLKQILRDVQRFSNENRRLLEDRITVFTELFESLEEDKAQETYDSDSQKETKSTGEAMILDEAI